MAKQDTAGKALVIVESPAKAKTINKYLGSDYVVKASMGHVRDLPQRDFGIDVSDDFRPTYEVVRGRTKVVGELKKIAAKASAVYLATDRDREGEAIQMPSRRQSAPGPLRMARVSMRPINPPLCSKNPP